MSYFENFKNHQIAKIVQFRKTAKFQNLTIWKAIKIPKISEIYSFENSINVQFEIFLKIPNISNFEKSKNL